jgi:hypothetical protein
MLKVNPDDRPSIDSVLEHPWCTCNETLKRVSKLYNSNESFLNSGELEETLVNVTLNDTDRSILTPPPKRRRIDYN